MPRFSDPRAYWIALNMVPGVGPITYRKLLNHFGTPEHVFSASMAALQAVPGVREPAARAIVDFAWSDRIHRELDALHAQQIQLLTWDDGGYPPRLRTIFDPPPVLYVKGCLDLLDGIAIALVGSRRASSYGRAVAEKLGQELAEKGVCVVSGMARGIDSAAHAGALRCGGSTVAVLGCGVDVVYPPENTRLYAQIAERGALLSEFPLRSAPDRGNFPARNRIISGLSLGTVVIEAGRQSGALITADMALDQGRDVFAVPGNITSNTSRGTHRLIKQGAHLVEEADDILQALSVEIGQQISATQPQLPLQPPAAPPPALTADEQRLYELLSTEPLHIDTLTLQSRLPSGTVSATLMMLEMKGVIKQQAGQMFVRT